MSSSISENSSSRLSFETSQEVQTVNTRSATENTATKRVAGRAGEGTTCTTNDEAEDSTSAAASENSPALQAEATKSAAFFEIIRKYASVSDMLRLSGAIAVAAAMGLFLLDGIEVVNDLQRFLTMLGFTGALTAAGFSMSLLLKEQSGSRVFISLALLSVPVNFTVIGALLYSVLPLDTMASNYPGYAHWQVGSVSDLAPGLAAGLAVLAPVIWLGFSVLARTARNWLSVALIASSAILIVPVRGELWSAGLAIGTTLLLWFVCKRYSSSSLALKTTEGKLAVALLFVAPVIVAVRSLFFYDVNGVLILTLSAGFFAYCRHLLAGIDKPGALSTLLTLLTSVAILCVCASAGDLLVNFMPQAWALFSVGIGLLLLSNDLLHVSPNRLLSGVIGLMFAGISTLLLLATTVFWSGMTLWVGLALITMVAYGLYYKTHLAAIIGGIGSLALISLNAGELTGYAQTVLTAALMTGWWGIAGIGVLAIVAGSMIDRAGTIVAVKKEN